MACPETGNSEWIELYNPDSSTYTLDSWKIRDSAGTRKTISGSIPAQGYATFQLSTSILNNDGDQVSLENPIGVTLATVSFGECQKGTSFIDHEGTWQQTFSVTKDFANIFFSDAENTSEEEFAKSDESSISSPSPSLKSSSLRPLVSTASSATSKIKKTPYPVASFSAEFLASLTDLHFKQVATVSTGTVEEKPFLPTSPSKLPGKFLILGPMAIGISLMATSSYLYYKWYTEKRAQEDFDFA